MPTAQRYAYDKTARGDGSGCTLLPPQAERAGGPQTEYAGGPQAERAGGRIADRDPARYHGRMEALLSFLQVIIAVVLILLVLLHSGKDAGLSGAFGVGTGQGPLGGGSLVERNLNRWTVFFAILFVGNTILLLRKPW
jgi:preprotein translocase subunit SecG